MQEKKRRKRKISRKRKPKKRRTKLELPSVRQQKKQVQAAPLKKNLGDVTESPRQKANLKLKVSLVLEAKTAIPVARKAQDNPQVDPAL